MGEANVDHEKYILLDKCKDTLNTSIKQLRRMGVHAAEIEIELIHYINKLTREEME